MAEKTELRFEIKEWKCARNCRCDCRMCKTYRQSYGVTESNDLASYSF